MCDTNFKIFRILRYNGNLGKILDNYHDFYTRFVNVQHRPGTEPSKCNVLYPAIGSILISTGVSNKVHSINLGKDSLIRPRNDHPDPFSARSRQTLCKRSNRRWDKRTSNTHETEEVPQALGFPRLMCTTNSDPHMEGPTIPFKTGGYEVCGDEFQERVGRREVYNDETNSICLYSPNRLRP